MQTTTTREDTIRADTPRWLFWVGVCLLLPVALYIMAEEALPVLRRRLWHALYVHPAGQVAVLVTAALVLVGGLAWALGPLGALAGACWWMVFGLWYCDATPREDTP